MSDAQSALSGASYAGYVTVREAGLSGMLTLRGDLGSRTLKKAVTDLTGATFPAQRGISHAGDFSVAWMSPDEVLIMLPHKAAAAACETLERALKGVRHLIVNVSDARARFLLSGAACCEVLAKLAPVDFSNQSFGPGELRRSRLAQVPAAFWISDDGHAHVVCFRSVAQYVFDILSDAARPGGEVN